MASKSSGKPKKSGEVLHIRFHNPNTNEEVAKLLVKVIAESIADNMLTRKEKSNNVAS